MDGMRQVRSDSARAVSKDIIWSARLFINGLARLQPHTSYYLAKILRRESTYHRTIDASAIQFIFETIVIAFVHHCKHSPSFIRHDSNPPTLIPRLPDPTLAAASALKCSKIYSAGSLLQNSFSLCSSLINNVCDEEEIVDSAACYNIFLIIFNFLFNKTKRSVSRSHHHLPSSR